MGDELKIVLDLMPTLRRIEESLEKIQKDINSLKNKSNNFASEPGAKLLKLPEVMSITKLCRTAVYDSVKQNKFPAPIKIGVRASAWLESEVYAWIEKAKNR